MEIPPPKSVSVSRLNAGVVVIKATEAVRLTST